MATELDLTFANGQHCPGQAADAAVDKPQLALDGQPPTPTVVAAGVDDGLALDTKGQDPGLTPAAALEEDHSHDVLGFPTDRGASGAVDASECRSTAASQPQKTTCVASRAPNTPFTPGSYSRNGGDCMAAELDLTFASGQHRPWQAADAAGINPPVAALDGQPAPPTAVAAGVDDGLAFETNGQTPGLTPAASLEEGRSKDALGGLPTDCGTSGAADASEGRSPAAFQPHMGCVLV